MSNAQLSAREWVNKLLEDTLEEAAQKSAQKGVLASDVQEIIDKMASADSSELTVEALLQLRTDALENIKAVRGEDISFCVDFTARVFRVLYTALYAPASIREAIAMMLMGDLTRDLYIHLEVRDDQREEIALLAENLDKTLESFTKQFLKQRRH